MLQAQVEFWSDPVQTEFWIWGVDKKMQTLRPRLGFQFALLGSSNAVSPRLWLHLRRKL